MPALINTGFYHIEGEEEHYLKHVSRFSFQKRYKKVIESFGSRRTEKLRYSIQ